MPVIAAFQQMPVEAAIVIPLPPLSKFVAHKQQFFTGEGPHPGVVGTQVGELLPRIAGHTIKNRFFTVHHFIVGEGQNKVFGVVIENAEGHLVMVEFTIDRIELHIVEGVVHPTEVPLVPKAQAALRRRA